MCIVLWCRSSAEDCETAAQQRVGQLGALPLPVTSPGSWWLMGCFWMAYLHSPGELEMFVCWRIVSVLRISPTTRFTSAEISQEWEYPEFGWLSPDMGLF